MVCGDNSKGQLGLGEEEYLNFTEVYLFLAKDECIEQVCTGSNHTLILTSNNRIFVSCDNQYGQLGLGHTKNQYTFNESFQGLIAQDELIQQLVAEKDSSLIITRSKRFFFSGTPSKIFYPDKYTTTFKEQFSSVEVHNDEQLTAIPA